ncbi:MAG: Asp-tRNA(Asn)/Glu-tRNA(Gln) amidotransferase subunit GatC [Elusimicrobiota bacterium]
MTITEKDVDYIAELARLELSPEEKKLYAGQLAGIFGWMEELNKADTSSVSPTANVMGLENALREDKPVAFEDREAILKNAPGREYDFVKVKKVME